MTRRVIVVCAILVFAAPCFGKRDKQFHALVKTIERQYGVHHTPIPFLGLATFCMRVAKVPGAAGLKVAVFQNLPKSNIASDNSFQESVQRIVGSAWHPLVRQRSREDGSVTMIYANPSADELRVLVVSVDGSEATVVQAKVSKSQIWKCLSEPQDAVDRDSDPPSHARLTITAD